MKRYYFKLNTTKSNFFYKKTDKNLVYDRSAIPSKNHKDSAKLVRLKINDCSKEFYLNEYFTDQHHFDN